MIQPNSDTPANWPGRLSRPGNSASRQSLLNSSSPNSPPMPLRHGTGPIDISLSHSGNELRTEVHDHGAGRPVRRRTTADDEQGRGLELLDGLIDLNGGAREVVNDTDGPGKTVYVALSLDSSQADTG